MDGADGYFLDEVRDGECRAARVGAAGCGDADRAAPPVAADLLLGRERVAGSQVIKQPDVLMLHHLVPGEVAAGSLAPNVDYYGPRTAHGSSLSPAVTASLLARAGRPDEALAMLGTALGWISPT